jgi:hypothetical protein
MTKRARRNHTGCCVVFSISPSAEAGASPVRLIALTVRHILGCLSGPIPRCVTSACFEYEVTKQHHENYWNLLVDLNRLQDWGNDVLIAGLTKNFVAFWPSRIIMNRGDYIGDSLRLTNANRHQNGRAGDDAAARTAVRSHLDDC